MRYIDISSVVLYCTTFISTWTRDTRHVWSRG